ncbi:MAG TPA: DUF3800 domain-containing protein [Candidatus Dormibacteraeota bacterium]|nr:DUF3800 domain-containing protein [Candidatus Dormibacteraeota bacterium]
MDITTGPKSRLNLFGYLDETGLLHTPATDKVFGLGLVVCQNPRDLHRSVISYKNSRHYSKHEFKFTDIRQKNLNLYKGLIDLFFDCKNINFSCVVYDKKELNIKHYFNGDHEKAYGVFVARLVSRVLEQGQSNKSSYVVLLADDVSTKKSDRFEKVVKDKVKMRLRRNAVFGVARLESHAVAEIQVCDVLLGIVAYSFKIKFGLVKADGAKVEIVKYLQRKLSAQRISETIEKRFKGGVQFSIEEYHPNKK